MENYSKSELMVVRASRELYNGEVVFVGIGLPNLTCNLAIRMHAPDLVLIYESGAIGSMPERLPISIGDPCLVAGALSVCPIADVFNYYLQGGHINVGLLGAAQIDQFGNINTTVIGGYKKPKVRLPGSGGACEIAIHANRVLIVTMQKSRIFQQQVDFITSPGQFSKNKDRKFWQMPGKGPVIVVTDLGVYKFDDESKEMMLVEIHPGVTFDEIRQNTGWNIQISPKLKDTETPTKEELKIIRKELDPDQIYIK